MLQLFHSAEALVFINNAKNFHNKNNTITSIQPQKTRQTMKKEKKYSKPSMQVYELHQQSHLMAASVPGPEPAPEFTSSLNAMGGPESL